MARMAPELAEKMSITDPWRYIRVAGSKENYAPPPERGTWYQLVGVELGNATEQYPEGDSVAVATLWQPPGMFAGMNSPTLAAVFAALREGTYSPNRQAKRTPWAGKVLIEVGGRSERDASRIIAAWIESGVLTKDKYYPDGSKHAVERVVLNDARATEIVAEHRDIEGAPE